MNEDISVEEIINSLKCSHRWKSSGIDKIRNFWYYYLSSSHQLMTAMTSEIINEPPKMPDWLTEGVTFQLLKTKK